MHQFAKKSPPVPPQASHLKLRRDSVDGTDSPEAGAAFSLDGDRVAALPGAALPRRCVCCGDDMDTLWVRTLRGNIRYALCREHAVVTVAKLLAGGALALLGAASLFTWVIGDPLVSTFGTLILLAIGALGAGFAYRSLPVRAGRPVAGRHPLCGLHPDVIADLKRSSR